MSRIDSAIARFTLALERLEGAAKRTAAHSASPFDDGLAANLTR